MQHVALDQLGSQRLHFQETWGRWASVTTDWLLGAMVKVSYPFS